MDGLRKVLPGEIDCMWVFAGWADKGFGSRKRLAGMETWSEVGKYDERELGEQPFYPRFSRRSRKKNMVSWGGGGFGVRGSVWWVSAQNMQRYARVRGIGSADGRKRKELVIVMENL